MSRGLGKIEKAIEAAFTAYPSATFSVLDLGPIAYPGLDSMEKKHRAAIIRAADKVAERLWWWKCINERPGGHVIYCNRLDVRSYAIGRLRTDFLQNDMSLPEIEQSLERPEPDGPMAHRSNWKLIQPGGAWWVHVEIEKARKAGNHAEADRLLAELTAGIKRK